MHACKNNNLKLAKLLVSFGADVKAENEEVSKHAACQYTFVMAAMLLCSACIPACPFSRNRYKSMLFVYLYSLIIYCPLLLRCHRYVLVHAVQFSNSHNLQCTGSLGL